MKDYRTHLDQELLYLVSNDNKAAYAELYSRYWQSMFVIAFNRIKEKETAEDIVHDVFASLWANRKKCRLIFKYSRNEGMPVKRIAAKLKLSRKTLENQLTKTVRKLAGMTAVSKVFEKLKLTGEVHFNIGGKKIIVSL